MIEQTIVVPAWAHEITPSKYSIRDAVEALLKGAEAGSETSAIRGMALLVYYAMDESVTPAESSRLVSWVKDLSQEQLSTIKDCAFSVGCEIGDSIDELLARHDGRHGRKTLSPEVWDQVADRLCALREDLEAVCYLIYYASRGEMEKGLYTIRRLYDGDIAETELNDRLRKGPRTQRRLEMYKPFLGGWWALDLTEDDI